jgi:hypothetical protein
MKAMVPATVGAGKGVSLGGAENVATGLGVTVGELDAVVLELPQAASARAAATNAQRVAARMDFFR